MTPGNADGVDAGQLALRRLCPLQRPAVTQRAIVSFHSPSERLLCSLARAYTVCNGQLSSCHGSYMSLTQYTYPSRSGNDDRVFSGDYCCISVCYRLSKHTMHAGFQRLLFITVHKLVSEASGQFLTWAMWSEGGPPSLIVPKHKNRPLGQCLTAMS